MLHEQFTGFRRINILVDDLNNNDDEDTLTQQHDGVDDGEGEHVTSDHLDNHSHK